VIVWHNTSQMCDITHSWLSVRCVSGPQFCERQHHSPLSVLSSVFPHSSQRMPALQKISSTPDCGCSLLPAIFCASLLFFCETSTVVNFVGTISKDVLVFYDMHILTMVEFGDNASEFDIVVHMPRSGLRIKRTLSARNPQSR